MRGFSELWCDVKAGAARVVVLLSIFCALPAALAEQNTTAFEGNVAATLTRTGMQGLILLFTRKANFLRIENTTDKSAPIRIVGSRCEEDDDHLPAKLDLRPYRPRQASRGATGAGSVPHVAPLPTTPSVRQAGRPGSHWHRRHLACHPFPKLQERSAQWPCPIPRSFRVKERQKDSDRSGAHLHALHDRAAHRKRRNLGRGRCRAVSILHDRGWRRGDHFGPPRLAEQWPELLRKKSLFPLDTVLRMGDRVRLTFKVTDRPAANRQPGRTFLPTAQLYRGHSGTPTCLPQSNPIAMNPS